MNREKLCDAVGTFLNENKVFNLSEVARAVGLTRRQLEGIMAGTRTTPTEKIVEVVRYLSGFGLSTTGLGLPKKAKDDSH